MNKRIVSLLMVVIVIVSMISGCGSRKAATESKADRGTETANSARNYGEDQVILQFNEDIEDGENGESPKTSERDDSGNTYAITGTGTTFQPSKVNILEQRKIIRNANVSIEVEDFDKTYGQISSIINGIGIIQETSIKKNPKYINGEKVIQTLGYITIRVYSDRFESVLSDVRGLGDLLDQNVTSNDITDQFFDTEARLKVLKIEYDLVEDYLKKVTDLDAIFKTQKRLTELRQEIENLTGTLNKWKDLVDLSTIRINISEKLPEVPEENLKEKSYFSKLASGFLDSSKGVIEFCGAFFIFMAQAIPVLIILVIFGFVLVFLYKKILLPIMKKNRPKDQNREM